MSKSDTFDKHQIRTAILVDGAFYRKRSRHLWGDKSPEERADELKNYCYRHLQDNYENRYLYRVFYYDCKPIDANVFDPVSKKTIQLGKSAEFLWMNSFLGELKHNRKFALRMGTLNSSQLHYNLKYDSMKKLLNGTLPQKDLTLNDFELNLEQKGVDMRIGVDISSLSFKRKEEKS